MGDKRAGGFEWPGLRSRGRGGGGRGYEGPSAFGKPLPIFFSFASSHLSPSTATLRILRPPNFHKNPPSSGAHFLRKFFTIFRSPSQHFRLFGTTLNRYVRYLDESSNIIIVLLTSLDLAGELRRLSLLEWPDPGARLPTAFVHQHGGARRN